MRVIQGDRSVADWVSSRITGVGQFGPCVAFGILDNDDRIVGGLVYHNFRPPSIEEMFAAESARCLSRSIIRELLKWPFEALGCTRINGLIAPDNHRSIKLTEGLGFKLEGTLRRADEGGRDLLLYGLTDLDFYEGKYGKEIRA